MSERVFDDAADFGHTLEYCHRPFGRECVYGAAGMEFVEAAVKRLGHDAVADPAWGDDEDFLDMVVGRFCVARYCIVKWKGGYTALPCRLAWKTSLSAQPLLSAVRNRGGRLKVKNI